MNHETNNHPQLDFSSLSEAERNQLVSFVRDEMGDEFILDENELIPIDLSDEQAGVIQQKLFSSLDRSNLGAEIIKFSTKGFIEFLMAVMRPAFSSPSRNKSQETEHGHSS